MRSILFLLFFFCYSWIYSQPPCAFKPGYMWLGQLSLNDSTELPFWFKIVKNSNKFSIEIYNAEEVIKVDEVKITQDSIHFKMPVFNSEFRCKWKTDDEEHDAMSGIWINHNRTKQHVIPFSASRRMIKPVSSCSCSEFIGKWEVDFSLNTPDHYKAIGQFKNGHCWDFVYGTFLTETGDYRFLSGNVNNDTLTLGCFDGSHAFYFKAYKLLDGTLKGQFYSGMHWSEPWVAKRNEAFELRNPDSITQVKRVNANINLAFNNTDGKLVTLSDELFKGKVTIIQIMGSWCPNCMDESTLLQEQYMKYANKGFNVIALSFEKTTDTALARPRVQRFKQRLKCTYPFLITGKTGKEEASAMFPMLNEIVAFPTTIYIDKKGTIRKVYTGFNGPGTGIYYEKSKAEMTQFIEMLINE